MVNSVSLPIPLVYVAEGMIDSKPAVKIIRATSDADARKQMVDLKFDMTKSKLYVQERREVI